MKSKQRYIVRLLDMDMYYSQTEETLNEFVEKYGEIDVVDITLLRNNLLQITICVLEKKESEE